MHSNEGKSPILRNEEIQDYGMPQTSFDGYEPLEFQFMSPFLNDLIPQSYSPQFLCDSSNLLAIHEKKVTLEEQEAKISTAPNITSFSTIFEKEVLPRDVITTRNATRKLQERSMVIGIQYTESNSVIGSITPTKLEKQRSTTKSKTKRQKKKSPPDERAENFQCKFCEFASATSQGLGGHMSRKHPGKSYVYKKKKGIRKTREVERYKLQLAKEKYFKGFDNKYKGQILTKEGKKERTKVLNRKELKRIKKSITKKELDDYIENEVLYSEGFEEK